MAILARSVCHVPLKMKMEERYPLPMPPNVSVEAIKRSLLHTPSPRRFKKLRLRRLQENLRQKEVTLQLPLVENSLKELGQRWKWDEGEDGGNGAYGHK
jgi:hypothetical protein